MNVGPQRASLETGETIHSRTFGCDSEGHPNPARQHHDGTRYGKSDSVKNTDDDNNKNGDDNDINCDSGRLSPDSALDAMLAAQLAGGLALDVAGREAGHSQPHQPLPLHLPHSDTDRPEWTRSATTAAAAGCVAEGGEEMVSPGQKMGSAGQCESEEEQLVVTQVLDKMTPSTGPRVEDDGDERVPVMTAAAAATCAEGGVGVAMRKVSLSSSVDSSGSRSSLVPLFDVISQLFVNPEQAGYVGFANLPNQVHRKSVKKGFEFTLMVVGESGLGKSTLVNSLFLTDLYPERHVPSAAEKIHQTVKIDASTVEIEERGVKLRLTVVDTPGFGDSLNSIDCFKPIIQYIDDQFERYLNDENGLNRRHIVDNRVHCCFYFINPSGHGLKPLDMAFMKAVHHKVNIVPVLAKADTLTQIEVLSLKKKILDQIDEQGIKIYPLPDCDSDEDEDYKEQCRQLKNAVPFAVVGANTIIEVKGRKVRGRMYPWGVVEVENPEHCDFIKLRTMLITHMQDLQEVTQETHYENFRADKLASGVPAKQKAGKPSAPTSRMENGTSDMTDKERELRQKEEELWRMQERLARMQAEIDSKRPNHIHNGDLKSQDV